MNERMLDIIEQAHRERCGERLFCYVESHRAGSVWGLSIAEESEPGHFPVSDDIATGSDQEMRGLATRLNRTRLSILPYTAAQIVASSMAGDGTRRRG